MITVDRSRWGRLRVTGSDRVRFLQGLTTVNVEALAVGSHAWGAILSPKGRVLSVVNLSRPGSPGSPDSPGDDSIIVACEPHIADKTRALLERYAVMDDVVFEPLEGPAYQRWDDAASVWTAPIVAGDGPEPVRAEDDPEVERLRIRGGFLRYGVDIGEDSFPFETPLARFLDYTKGCYVGQEPVFRVHAQGNAARALRGLALDGAAPIAAGTALDAPAKGSVTSSVADGDITRALGFLHRTCWEPGSTVQIAGRTATVYELPW